MVRFCEPPVQISAPWCQRLLAESHFSSRLRRLSAEPEFVTAELIAWVAFYNNIIAGQCFDEFFSEDLCGERFVELFVPKLAHLAPFIATTFGEDENSSLGVFVNLLYE
jgi:hypothetical protein